MGEALLEIRIELAWRFPISLTIFLSKGQLRVAAGRWRVVCGTRERRVDEEDSMEMDIPIAKHCIQGQCSDDFLYAGHVEKKVWLCRSGREKEGKDGFERDRMQGVGWARIE